jgi:hypothetical protein
MRIKKIVGDASLNTNNGNPKYHKITVAGVRNKSI